MTGPRCLHLAALTALAALWPGPVLADPLSESERQALIDRLDELRDEAKTKVKSRFGNAVEDFQAAIQSSKTALALYLKCVEKADFEDQGRSAQAFREWKRRQDDRLDDPAFAVALRHQLRWTLLAMKASAEPEQRLELAPEAATILEAIYRTPEELRGQTNVLAQSVSNTVFARAYGLDGYEVEGWPMAPVRGGWRGREFHPVEVNQPFDQLIFPALRQGKDFDGLRQAWTNRIRYEEIARQFWSRDAAGSPSEPTPERTRFLTERKPDLVWLAEEDLFKAGDERAAALRMLEHLEQYIGHSKARDWEARFRQLVDPLPEGDESAHPTGA